MKTFNAKELVLKSFVKAVNDTLAIEYQRHNVLDSENTPPLTVGGGVVGAKITEGGNSVTITNFQHNVYSEFNLSSLDILKSLNTLHMMDYIKTFLKLVTTPTEKVIDENELNISSYDFLYRLIEFQSLLEDSDFSKRVADRVGSDETDKTIMLNAVLAMTKTVCNS